MTGIDKGFELVRRACEDQQAVPAAQQILRNWHHRLDRLTVLDGTARSRIQRDIEVLVEWLGRAHADQPSLANRQAEAERQIEPIRRKLIALVGKHGLD